MRCEGGDARENARIIEDSSERRARAGARRRAAERRRGAVHRRRRGVRRGRHRAGIARDRPRRCEANARAAGLDLDRGGVRGRSDGMTESQCQGRVALGVGAGPTADLLATIVAATRRIVEVRQEREPLAGAGPSARRSCRRVRSFRGGAAARADRVNIIAECKRRSPSKGVLRPDYDPVAIARGYADAGAAAISVLTEPTFFDGRTGAPAGGARGGRCACFCARIHRLGVSAARGQGGGRRRGAVDCRRARGRWS